MTLARIQNALFYPPERYEPPSLELDFFFTTRLLLLPLPLVLETSLAHKFKRQLGIRVTSRLFEVVSRNGTSETVLKTRRRSSGLAGTWVEFGSEAAGC